MKTIKAWGVVVQEYRFSPEVCWAWSWPTSDTLPFVTYAFFRTRTEARKHVKELTNGAIAFAFRARVVRVELPAPKEVCDGLAL